jgi:hypothetical protein
MSPIIAAEGRSNASSASACPDKTKSEDSKEEMAGFKPIEHSSPKVIDRG